MTIQAISGRADSNGSKTSGISGADSGVFMQLLMTQLQSQDPLSPMDTNSFVSQLVQFNTLDQISQIRELVQSMQINS